MRKPKRITKTRWVIVNRNSGAMLTGYNESLRDTAIRDFVWKQNSLEQNNPWLEWKYYRGQGFAAVKAVVETVYPV